MAKKKKKTKSQRAPTKHQLSKWERQMKIRRIVIIAAAVFVAGILSWVGYGYYNDTIAPRREVVIEVNDARFTMDYYVKVLDLYTTDMEPNMVYYAAGMVADNIIEAELLKQGAEDLGIEATKAEVDERMEQYGLPDDEVYRDVIRSVLVQEKLEEHLASQLPDTMEQAHVQVMLVESEEVAEEVTTALEAGGNFTALVDEFSHYPEVEGDLGWLPRELMPNAFIEQAAFAPNITVGHISEPMYDETVSKTVGYWLIEVLNIVDDEEDQRKIEARAILLGSEAEAQLVKTELVGGNFTSLAKEYSQHQSKEFGGMLGWLERGDMQSAAFDEAAFALDPGEVEGPVKDESVRTTGGYWLVRIVDRAERELEDDTRQQLVGQQLDDWLEEQREKATIEDRLDEEKIGVAVEEVLRKR
ncbi:MAG: peptidylprolyl isomerase [Dehalococcoidia bacterium]